MHPVFICSLSAVYRVIKNVAKMASKGKKQTALGCHPYNRSTVKPMGVLSIDFF